MTYDDLTLAKQDSIARAVLNRPEAPDLHPCPEGEARSTTIGAHTEIYGEGIGAFVEKRAAQFKGYSC
jgi:hypothetical protein